MPLLPQPLPVLMYHDLVHEPQPGRTTVQEFERHLQALREAGYVFWSSAEFERIQCGQQPPARGVLITFDDGYTSTYRDALPILRAHGARACLFAITGALGEGPVRPRASQCKAEDPYLRWSEVERLMASGTFDVQSHTHRHRRWRQIANLLERMSVLQDDLMTSRRLLKQRLGVTSTHLAWPWGDFDDHYVRQGRQAGFHVFYAAHRRPNRVGDAGLEVGRLNCDGRSASGLLWGLRSDAWGADRLLAGARGLRAWQRSLTDRPAPTHAALTAAHRRIDK